MFDFPNAPAVGDTYTQGGGPKYTWDGTTWNVTIPPVLTLTDYVLKAGDIMTGALSLPLAMPTVDAHAAHKKYVDSKSGIGEAPIDTTPYVRQDAAWISQPGAAAGDYVMKTGDTMSGGLGFGNQAQTAVDDLSRHIALYGTMFGFNITSGTLNYVVPDDNKHSFVTGNTMRASIDKNWFQLWGGTGLLVSGTPAGQPAVYIDDGNLQLRKGNTTVGIDSPNINFEVNGHFSNSNDRIAYITCHHLSRQTTYNTGDKGQIEIRVNDGYYGTNKQSLLIDYQDIRVASSVYANGVALTSDAKLKEDIKPLSADEIDAAFAHLNPVSYRWKSEVAEQPLSADGPVPKPRLDSAVQWGFVAQDVEAGAANLISSFEGKDEKAYDLGGVVAVLAAKLKQVETELKALQSKMKTITDMT